MTSGPASRQVLPGSRGRPPLSVPLALSMIDRWGERPYVKQLDIVRALFGGARTTVVQANTGAGKSRVAAAAFWAFLGGGPDRLVVTTAPTQRQVNLNVWKEARKIHAAAEKSSFPLGGKLAPKSAMWTGANGRMAIGYASGDPVNYAGTHSPGGTLFILDDAQGIDDDVWDTIQNTCTGVNDRILALANPIRASGRFFELCTTRGGSAVNRLKISAYDSPNVIAGRSVIDGMATVESIENIRAVYGEGSAVWKSRVLGEFPDTDDDLALVPLSWLEESRKEYEAWVDHLHVGADIESITAAADLAGLGRDHGVSSIIREFQARTSKGIPFRALVGDELIRHPKYPVENTMGTVGFLAAQHRSLTPSPQSFRVDKVGLGQGVYDRLREIGIPTVGMSGGRAASDPSRFVNERAEVLYSFREALQPRRNDGKPDQRPVVMLPWNDRLVYQATSLRMTFDSTGKIKMEPKKEWAKRQTDKERWRSPDELDAVAMSLCADPPDEDAGGVGAFLRAYGE